MKKIRMSFGVVKTIIIAAILIGILALIGLDIAMLAKAKGATTFSPALPAVSIVAAILIGVAALLLLVNSRYVFKEAHLLILVGFFADKLAYSDIVKLKQNIATKELILLVNTTSGEQTALKVNVSAGKTDAFMSAIREHIPNIEVEMFEEPKKKDKK